MAIILTMLNAVAAPAMANDFPAGSVGDVLDNCEAVSAYIFSGNPNVKTGICLGFVSAVIQGLQLRRAAGDNIGVCLPSTLSNGDVVAIFVSWAKSRSHSSQQATLGIYDALRQQYPCK